MKKLFLNCLVIALSASFASNVFAEQSAGTNYHTRLEPIAQTLNAPSMGEYGPATDIVIINFSEKTIHPEVYGTIVSDIGPRTSERIIENDRLKDSDIQISDASTGAVFFPMQGVGNHATISVYISGGKYVYYITYPKQ